MDDMTAGLAAEERETLLACGPNEDEGPLPEALERGVLGTPLDTLLSRNLTVASSLANAQELGLDGRFFWIQLAQDFYAQLPTDLLALIDQGCRLTSTDELANLSMYALALDGTPGIGRDVNYIRLLGLFQFAERRAPNAEHYYVRPDSIGGAFAVMTSHRETFINVVHRYRRFIEWADVEYPSDPKNNLRKLVEAGAGMSYEDYIRCITALHGFYDDSRVRVNGAAAILRSEINPTSPLKAWLEKYSISSGELKDRLGIAPLVTLRDKGHFIAFETPFVRHKEKFWLLNPKALDNMLGVGLYFVAMNAKTAGTEGDDRRRAAQDLGAIAGRFHEAYAGELLESIAKRSGSSFSKEVKDDNDLDSTDYFVLENGRLAFVEMHNRRVPRPTIESLDDRKIDAEFRNILQAKISSIDRNMAKFESGALVVPGIDRSTVREMFPIICLSSQFPRSEEVQQRIDAFVNEKKWCSGKGGLAIAPLEILDIETLECLDGIEGMVSICDFVTEKTATRASRVTFFKNFLVLTKKLALRVKEADRRSTVAFLERFQTQSAGWLI